MVVSDYTYATDCCVCCHVPSISLQSFYADLFCPDRDMQGLNNEINCKTFNLVLPETHRHHGIRTEHIQLGKYCMQLLMMIITNILAIYNNQNVCLCYKL